MRSSLRTALVALTAAGAAMATAGCADFLSVTDPRVINAEALDPVKDATTFSLSARQNLAFAAGQLAVWSGHYSGETWPAETNNQSHDFARRDVDPLNLTVEALWEAQSVALVLGDKVFEILAGTPGESANVDLARAALVSGYALELMAEAFCEGVIAGGPLLTTTQLLDTAVVRLTRAIDVGAAAATNGNAEGADIVNAAYVGRARAHLQAGRRAEALADAAQVEDGFEYHLLFLDSPVDRNRFPDRVNNPYVALTVARKSVVVPPAFRVNDPRIPWLPPAPAQLAVDNVTPFFHQTKYQSYGSPIRLASRLEADYIAAEVQGTPQMLALIAARRAANGLPPYDGPTDAASVLVELMEQRGRDFWLEGKRMGDFRRNPDAVLHVPEPGAPFFKPGSGPVGSGTCWPVPATETSNNPNIPPGS